MPQLRTTPARMESARRLVIQELWAQDQYVWTAADQRAFVDVLAPEMMTEHWISVYDMVDYIYSWTQSR